MSNNDEQGGGKPPPDDRTLLEPLSNDELHALRQARQKAQRQRMVSPGPESDDLGSEDRTIVGAEDHTIAEIAGSGVSLPGFEGKVSLDQISAPPEPRTPSRERSHRSESASAVPAAPTQPEAPREFTPGASGASGPPAPGFGANTLMWMQPPKRSGPSKTQAVSELMPPRSSKETMLANVRAVVVVGALGLMTTGLVFATVAGGRSGVVELHTDPNGARVVIDGQAQDERTPVKLTMGEGSHVIELSKSGYEAMVVRVEVNPDKPARQDVSLKPESRPGRKTVTINIQPVVASITIDGRPHPSSRTLRVPNVDPGSTHTIEISAPGYRTVVETIAAGTLQEDYSFVLQAESGSNPQ